MAQNSYQGLAALALVSFLWTSTGVDTQERLIATVFGARKKIYCQLANVAGWIHAIFL
jgi:hypothetical protein